MKKNMKQKQNKKKPSNMNVTITESSINKFKELINLTLDMCKDQKEFNDEIEINFAVICNYYNFLLEQYFYKRI